MPQPIFDRPGLLDDYDLGNFQVFRLILVQSANFAQQTLWIGPRVPLETYDRNWSPETISYNDAPCDGLDLLDRLFEDPRCEFVSCV
jgi:hypothetical protein